MGNPDYERKFGLSPIFRQRNSGTVAANAYFSYDWEVREPTGGAKYLPFNLLILTNNNTSSPLELYVNGDVTPIKYIPAGTIVTLDEQTLPAFRSVVIKNMGSTTIAAGEIEIVAQRVAITEEKIVQNLHRDIVSKKYAAVQ